MPVACAPACCEHAGSCAPCASWQRYKDSLIPEERDQWIQRYRLEWRYTY